MYKQASCNPNGSPAKMASSPTYDEELKPTPPNSLTYINNMLDANVRCARELRDKLQKKVDSIYGCIPDEIDKMPPEIQSSNFIGSMVQLSNELERVLSDCHRLVERIEL